MPLSDMQAENICKECIRKAAGYEGAFKPNDKLEDLGVVDTDVIRLLIDTIVTNEDVGVPSFGYQIDPNFLDLHTGTRFFVMREQVIDNSEPDSEEI